MISEVMTAHPYLVSELLEGETLRERIRSGLPQRRAVEFAQQIATGLAAAHEFLIFCFSCGGSRACVHLCADCSIVEVWNLNWPKKNRCCSRWCGNSQKTK